MQDFRLYNPGKDKKAVRRIWREVGWVKSKKDEEMMDFFLSEGRVFVADLNGVPECISASAPGSINYLEEELRLSAVTAVVTSRIARKQGLAKRLTAALIAAEALDGALVSALGIFEQGFYDRLGYGTGSYEHWFSFDPAILRVDRRLRVPRRLTTEDWEMVHHALLNRQVGHGACRLLPAPVMRAEMGWTENGFGLGYCDGANGELTHFFWGSAEGEHGPNTITFMAYQNGEQLLELLALIKSLGDQVRLVWMREPRDIQLQDLLAAPFKHRQITKKSKYENQCETSAYWQARICNLEDCLSHTRLRGTPVRFNLRLYDPIEKYLAADAPWKGLAGDYVVELGETSIAEKHFDTDLPKMQASVGAFTRLWLGIRPASGLAITDELDAPACLLKALDEILNLPDAKPDWEF